MRPGNGKVPSVKDDIADGFLAGIAATVDDPGAIASVVRANSPGKGPSSPTDIVEKHVQHLSVRQPHGQ